ncbi:MAG: hypothetical protein L0099_12345 [Acidobacteria bacterium]|nr:hypothetical protein [Acidobacteriota bacterium]
MADTAAIRELVERVVSDALGAQMEKIRREIAQRVLAEIEPLLGTEPGTSPTDQLNAAISSFQDMSAQAEILRSLLDGSTRFSGRSALLVIRSGAATGWEGRGFESSEVKGLSLSTSDGLVGRAVQDRGPAAAAAAEFDSGFISSAGNPVDGNGLVLPLVVRDKVAAVLYADAGTNAGGKLDPAALHVLVRAAGQWLELMALKKAGVTPAGEAAPEGPAAKPVEAPPTPSARPAPPPPERAPEAAAVEAVIPPEEAEIHKKAKRKAKVLVEEISLYNKSKVAEGRQNRDLYDRLKEDIDKSRAEYDRAFSKGPAASADYFTKELIRILAQNDRSLLGDNFPG